MQAGALRVLVATSLFAAAASQGTAQSLDDDELAALATAVQQVQDLGPVRWLMVSDHTMSFACESAATTGFSVGDCSGMRSRSQSPAEVLAWVREALPAVSKELTDSLSTRAAASVPVPRPLPLNSRQVIWGPTGSSKIPEGLGSPDFALYPSRVGFNAARDMALLYIGVMSWTDSSKSFGEYVFLVKTDGRWAVKGRARVWRLG